MRQNLDTPTQPKSSTNTSRSRPRQRDTTVIPLRCPDRHVGSPLAGTASDKTARGNASRGNATASRHRRRHGRHHDQHLQETREKDRGIQRTAAAFEHVAQGEAVNTNRPYRPPAIPAPRSVIPPKPRAPDPGSHAVGFTRKFPLPPTLGSVRNADAVYVLDTGVGLAFAHVDHLALLAAHYAGQLEYVDDVRREWASQAGQKIDLLPPGHTAAQKAEHDSRVHLRAAAKKCIAQVPGLVGDAVDLGYEELENVHNLITELNRLHPRRPSTGGDRGESASVRLCELRREHKDVVVLCTNDDRGRRLAGTHGIAYRNAGNVLCEMTHEGRLTAEDAYEHYQKMVQLSGFAEWARMDTVDDFR